MLIYCDRYGRLGNNLFQLSTLISGSIRSNFRLLNFYFLINYKCFRLPEYSHELKKQYFRISGSILFNKLINRILLTFLHFIYRNGFGKILNICFRNCNNDKDPFDLNDKRFISDSKKGILVLSGWYFFDREGFTENSALIRKLFSLRPDFENRVMKFISQFDGFLKIGVHIRRGDFRVAHNGAYYFDDDFYIRRILEVRDLFSSSIPLVFILYSDEPVRLESASPVNIAYGIGDEIVDLYSMSCCDYILASNSTYACWASFIGEKPMFLLDKGSTITKLEEFRICRYYIPDHPVFAD